jgi:uncharacterized protein (TIGR00290 family)
MSNRPKLWMCWSSGKDSAFTVHTLRTSGDFELCGLLTTITERFDRVSMHGVRRQLLERQARELGLPLVTVAIPSPCSNEQYEACMAQAVARARGEGVTHMAFGDLFLEDVRAYRESMLEPTGITPVFPLWGRPTAELAHDMIDCGLRAVLTCVDPRIVPRSFAGRSFDRALLSELPSAADPCAERGEFHTFCHAGPMFARSIDVSVGDVVERDGFVFADVLPGSSAEPG